MNPWLTDSVVSHVDLYLGSYRRLLGVELLPDSAGLSREERALRLFEAPVVALSHGTESDPLYDYGNRLALTLWEMPWEEFVGMPSRLCAEPVHRAEREELLRSVAEQGYAKGLSGIRISKGGRRFRIEELTVWNLVDERGTYRGQGASYSRYTYL